jgi:hypothetical protein
MATFFNYIANRDNMTVKFENGALSLSKDGGETFPYSLPVPMTRLNYVYLFKDGEFLFATDTKVYYTHDWQTYQESTVIGIDGQLFVPSQYNNFTSHRQSNARPMINGVEVLLWGNYTVDAGVAYENINLWYTKDKGATIKSCYKFNHSAPLLYTRHVHAVNFNPFDNSYWVQTGDDAQNGKDCAHVFKGYYNLQTDTWTWELIGSGGPLLEWAWAGADFTADAIYWAWDAASNISGIMKAAYADITDITKHVRLLSTPEPCSNMFLGERGDIIAYQNMWGNRTERPRNFYYSPNKGANWYKIEGPVPSNMDYQLTYYLGNWPPDAQGRVMAAVFGGGVEPLETYDRLPAVFIEETIKAAGFPDAFKPTDKPPVNPGIPLLYDSTVYDSGTYDLIEDTQAPGAPANLRVEVISPTSLKLLCDPAVDNAIIRGYNWYSFNVYPSKKNTETVSATEFIFSNLEPGRLYELGVEAVDSSGNTSVVSIIKAGTGRKLPLVTARKNKRFINPAQERSGLRN